MEQDSKSKNPVSRVLDWIARWGIGCRTRSIFLLFSLAAAFSHSYAVHATNTVTIFIFLDFFAPGIHCLIPRG